MANVRKDIKRARITLDNVRAVIEELQEDLRAKWEADDDDEQSMDTYYHLDDILGAIHVIDEDLQPYTVKETTDA